MLGYEDMNALDHVIEDRVASGLGGRWYGVFPALVTDINDPDGQGRVKVRLPWAQDTGRDRYDVWARLATMMAGSNRGSWFIPDVGDEVLIAFEGGDARSPFILGGLWNGVDQPPESMDRAGKNFKKSICSRNGVKLTFDDTDGQEQLIAETPAGQTITMKDGPGSIEVKDSNGNSVKLDSSGITVNAAAKVTVNASVMEVSVTMLTVNAGMSKFSGIVKCDTLISNSVVSTSYTPGAGNIW